MAMTRITTNMIMRNYQNNLTSTLGGLESTRKQVETGRRFSQSYEDPAASAKAAILERRYARNADYISNVTNVQKWQDIQEDAATSLSSVATEIAKNYSIAAVNGATGETGRDAYATALRSMQEAMVVTLNAKYGDTYVLAGTNGTEAPFKLTDDGKLLYKGVDVTDGDPDKLAEMAAEHSYIDLGFGLSIDSTTGEIDASSAFEAALPGINLVGYGKDANGNSKNMVVLVGQMAEILEKEPFDDAQYRELWDAFTEGSDDLRDHLAEIGTKTKLLQSTQTRLESETLAITEQFDQTVNIDPAEAIMNYSWANYAYNSALKVGTGIITPSLLDFMK